MSTSLYGSTFSPPFQPNYCFTPSHPSLPHLFSQWPRLNNFPLFFLYFLSYKYFCLKEEQQKRAEVERPRNSENYQHATKRHSIYIRCLNGARRVFLSISDVNCFLIRCRDSFSWGRYNWRRFCYGLLLARVSLCISPLSTKTRKSAVPPHSLHTPSHNIDDNRIYENHSHLGNWIVSIDMGYRYRWRSPF